MTVCTTVTFLWNATLSPWLNGAMRFRNCCLISYREDEGGRFLRNVAANLTTWCHILEESQLILYRFYIKKNYRLLGCYVLWQVTEHTLTFRWKQILVPRKV